MWRSRTRACLLVALTVLACAPATEGQFRTRVRWPPIVTIPPVTIPPVTIPPVTILPVTIPPITIPPVTIPTVNIRSELEAAGDNVKRQALNTRQQISEEVHQLDNRLNSKIRAEANNAVHAINNEVMTRVNENVDRLKEDLIQTIFTAVPALKAAQIAAIAAALAQALQGFQGVVNEGQLFISAASSDRDSFVRFIRDEAAPHLGALRSNINHVFGGFTEGPASHLANLQSSVQPAYQTMTSMVAAVQEKVEFVKQRLHEHEQVVQKMKETLAGDLSTLLRDEIHDLRGEFVALIVKKMVLS